MALELATALKTGVTASYHRISRVLVDLNQGTTSITVFMYLDANTRQAGKEPVSLDQFEVASALTEDSLLPQAYEALKELDQYKGSKDV